MKLAMIPPRLAGKIVKKKTRAVGTNQITGFRGFHLPASLEKKINFVIWHCLIKMCEART